MTTAPRQSDRAFGLMFTGVFGAAAAIAYFAFDTLVMWLLGLAATFLIVALAAPSFLMPLNRLWALFAVRLGHLNNYLLLGLFFYAIVLPAGLMMRVFTDPMKREIDRQAPTYWSAVGRKADRETYRDLF